MSSFPRGLILSIEEHMRPRFQIILLILALVSLAARAQPQRTSLPRDTLAMVDSWAITTQDLFERIELMPFELKTEEHDFESIKRKAVESLVGERLLSLMNSDRVPSDQWHVPLVRTVLQKLFVRDAMYVREVQQQASVSASEVREGLRRYAARRRLLAVHVQSDQETQQISGEWGRRRRNHDLNASILAGLRNRQDTLLIGFGSADTTLEEAAYRLKDTLSVFGPVHSRFFGMLVISMIGEEPNPDAAGKSAADRQKAVSDILRQRKESVLARGFVDDILRGQRMEADTTLFRAVARGLWQLMRSDTLARQVPRGYRFMPEDIYRLLSEFRTKIDSPIVHGSFGTLSLGEFLQNLFHYDFTIPSLRPLSFTISFFEILRTMTEAEMIAREGFRRGLERGAEVERDVSTWMGYWKSRFAEFAVSDTVTYPEWAPYWSLWRNNPALVESTCVFRVQEILRPDSLSAFSMMHLLQQGKTMDPLAHAASIRSAWQSHDGWSGWMSFQDNRALASKLMMMSVGETKGPLKLPEGYSVVKLLDRKFKVDAALLDSLWKREGRRMRIAHQQTVVNQSIAKAALQHRVDINYNRIRKADVSDVNIMTRRLIGFGGRINVAPLLVPQWQWVNEWKRMKSPSL